MYPGGVEAGTVTEEVLGVGVGKPGLGGLQSKLMPQIPKPHSDTEALSEIWKLTETAPPHWSFETCVPDGLQEVVCLQVDPPGISNRKSTSTSTETKRLSCVMEKVFPSPRLIDGPELPRLILPSIHLPCNVFH